MRHAALVIGRIRRARLFARRDEGQDLIEYGLLAALISVFAVAAVTALGQTIYDTFWQAIANNF